MAKIRTRLTLRERFFPKSEFRIVVAPHKAQLRANSAAITGTKKAIRRRERKLKEVREHLRLVKELKEEIHRKVAAGSSIMPWKAEDVELLKRARAAVEHAKQRITLRQATLAELQREREAIQKEIDAIERRYYGAPLERTVRRKAKNPKRNS